MINDMDLSGGSIPAHLRRIAIPYCIGITFAVLYSLVDAFFAGLLSTDALAALAISFPIFYVLTSIGMGVNAAAVALIGNALGSGNLGYAKRLACQGLSYAVTVSALLGVIGFTVMPWLVDAVTGPGPVRDLAVRYLNILFIALPAFVVFFYANGILVTQGSAIMIMRAQIATVLSNIVLTPVMIFGIPGLVGGLGFHGIAVSSLIVQTCAMLYVLRAVLRSEVMRHEVPASYRVRRDDFRDFTAQTLPTGIALSLIVFSGYIVQLYLQAFGSQMIAAFGIGVRVEQLFLLPGVALAFALRPIVARNYGANEYGRVREAFIYCCKSGLLLMSLAAVAICIGRHLAMRLFTDDPDVVRAGAHVLLVLGLLMPFTFLMFSVQSLLQGMKHSTWVLWIIIYERGFGIAFFCALFVVVWGMSTWGVWLGIATSIVSGTLLAFVIATLVARREIGGLFRG